MLEHPVRSVLLACTCIAAVTAQNDTALSTDAGSQVRLRYASFDPTVAEPAVPAALRSSGAQRLWIAQFSGVPLQADRDAVAASGGEVIGYLPDDSYVVRMDREDVATLRARASVRWVGRYHVAYRLEPELSTPAALASQQPHRVNIVVANKHTDKPGLIAAVQALGGDVVDEHRGSLLLEVAVTGPQLLQLAGRDEVLWIDRWTPIELDMDNARIQGGGNYFENQTGYTGQGVNAHIYEGCEAGHQDFTNGATSVLGSGAEAHGHCTAGIIWGNGNSNANVRGMAPDCGKFFTNYSTVTASRWEVFDELVNNRNVSLSSASWGNQRTFFYTGVSAESDDIVFDHDLPWTQSQSNAGNQDSRPQAWAKNVTSIGAVYHFDDANPNNDAWNGGASIGPAQDGRIKPTLCAYYDNIGASDLSGAAGYSGGNFTAGFGGTSGATPICAGHFVLLLQMFADETGTPGFGKFGNALRVPGGTAHQNRPHFPTLKALMVANATQYAFTSSSNDNRREHQGWGFPDLQTVWDRRDATFIVDETSVLTNGALDAWKITVAPGEPSLKVCLNWSEPAGNPAAASQLVNNLSLRVMAPNGTQYWGNHGLEAGVWSQTGGSEDTINSIENVFVQSPAAGEWYVQVFASSVVADNHLETSQVDCDYGLVVTGGTGEPADPGVFGQWESIGRGCDGLTCLPTIYEYPSFDLANSGITFEYVNGDYQLVPGQGTWIPPAGQNLGLGDNDEVIRNVGFSLPYPGGSTSTLRICSNGWVSDGAFMGQSNIAPSVADFLSQTTWAPLWRDLNPGATGGVWFDSTGQRLVITWYFVPNFFNSGFNNFQVQFEANGTVHYVYQTITVSGDYLVGFCAGGAADPGSTDLSASVNSGLGVCSGTSTEMTLVASARPVLGTTFNLVTDDLPAGTLVGTYIFSLTPLNPGFSLTSLGMPGCELYQTLDILVPWAQAGSTGTLPWPLPNDPSIAAFEAWVQGAALVPGINPFGFAVSNGIKITTGLN